MTDIEYLNALFRFIELCPQSGHVVDAIEAAAKILHLKRA